MATRLLAKQAKLITRLTKWPQTVAESLNYDDPREVIEAIDRGLETIANDWEDFRTNHRRLEDEPGIESTTYFANDDYEVANLAYVKGAGKIEALRPQPSRSPRGDNEGTPSLLGDRRSLSTRTTARSRGCALRGTLSRDV
jgi:hypothetical protein